MAKIVQIAELTVYGEEDEVLLDDLSFTVDRGEVAQLTGLSNTQYQTLFEVLTGELTPDSGQVVLADRNIVRLSKKKRKKMLREEVSFLPRELYLPERKTLLESLIFKLKITGSRNELEERAAEAISLTDLDGAGETLTAELGPLESFKAALALSIINNPDLIVCRGPFTSMGSNQRGEVVETLTTINESTGISVLLLTDDLGGAFEHVEVVEKVQNERGVG